MRKDRVWPAAALLLVGAASGALAQQRGAPGAAAAAQQCDLKASHHAVNLAVLYIQNASSTQDSTKRKQALDGARRSLLEALEQGQDKNPAVWYYLGFYYTLEADARGADSAFDKLEAMMPPCAKEVEELRANVWAKVANQGIEALRQNDYEKAKEYFRLANQVYDKNPTASFYLGTVFASEDNADSALHYFKLAGQLAAADTAEKEIHEKSVQNVARIYQVLEQWDSAQAYFRAYRAIRPDDPEGLSGLANAYLSGGDTAQAVAIYDSALAKAERLDATELFRIGVALFRADRADRAARAFELGLERNPHYRNGLFNLTNAYFSLAQNAKQPDSTRYFAGKMLPVAQRLAAIDPANRSVLRLVAAAYQLLGKDDSTDAVLKHVSQMQYEVEVQSARATNGGYEVQGVITALAPPGLQAVQDSIARDSSRLETLKQTTVPAAQRAQLQRRQATLQAELQRLRAQLEKLQGPVTVPAITFEFLDAKGNVVATEQVASQTIDPRTSRQFQLTPTGQGIVAWRYRTS